jgi:hypothetical protein
MLAYPTLIRWVFTSSSYFLYLFFHPPYVRSGGEFCLRSFPESGSGLDMGIKNGFKGLGQRRLISKRRRAKVIAAFLADGGRPECV